MTEAKENLSYRDIKSLVLERIQGGVWPPETLLPSETDLVAELSSTRTTVNRALRELADEGYLERNRRAGTRVLKSPRRLAQFTIPLIRDEIEATGASYRYALVERRDIPAPAWLQAQLDLRPNQPVLALRCVHYADGAPFQYEMRWIVIEVVPEARKESFSVIGPNEWLVRSVPFTNLELSFAAAKADQEIGAFLGVPPGDPVFFVERKTWLQAAPVTYARLFHGSGYRLTTRA